MRSLLFWLVGEEKELLYDMSKVPKMLLTLTPKEERVIRLRFGIGDKAHTLAEVGKEFKLTRERIRQIEAKALRKLRHPSRLKRLIRET